LFINENEKHHTQPIDWVEFLQSYFFCSVSRRASNNRMMVGWSESTLLVLRSSLHSLSFSLPSPLGPNEGTALLHDTAGVPSTPSPLTSAESHGTVTQTHRQADGIIRGPRAPHRERSAHQLPSPYGTHAPIPCAHNHPNDPARFSFPPPNHRTHSRHDPAARMKAIPGHSGRTQIQDLMYAPTAAVQGTVIRSPFLAPVPQLRQIEGGGERSPPHR
jgi:hypothetical protein